MNIDEIKRKSFDDTRHWSDIFNDTWATPGFASLNSEQADNWERDLNCTRDELKAIIILGRDEHKAKSTPKFMDVRGWRNKWIGMKNKTKSNEGFISFLKGKIDENIGNKNEVWNIICDPVKSGYTQKQSTTHAECGELERYAESKGWSRPSLDEVNGEAYHRMIREGTPPDEAERLIYGAVIEDVPSGLAEFIEDVGETAI